MGEVERLRAEGQEPQPGVDAHFETTIGEGRVLRLSTTFFQGTPLASQQKILRDILSLADRERAQYELQDLRWQFALKEKGVSRVDEDIARISATNETRRAQIDVELKELSLEESERAAKHEQAFRTSGRQGNFKRSSSQQLELDNIRKDMERLKVEALNLSNAQTNEKRDLETALARVKQDIGMLKEEIEKRLMILGLPSEL